MTSNDVPPVPRGPTLGQRADFARQLVIWEAAAHAPERVARRLPAQLGRLWYISADPRRRAQVRRNLARVRPEAGDDELTRLVRAAYDSYARYWVDAFRLHRRTGTEVAAATTGERLHHLDAVGAADHGGILATAHLGSWDVGALFATQRGWGVVAVAELLEPRALFDRFVRLREQAGIGVIPLVPGGDMITQLEARVRDDGALATLLADRDLTGKGPIVELFGAPCRLPPGCAVLARRTGLPVHVGAYLTAGDGYHMVVQDPIELAHLDVWEGTQALARALEDLIGRFPDQWHMFVRTWLADREPDHPVVTAWQAGSDWRPLARAEHAQRSTRGTG